MGFWENLTGQDQKRRAEEERRRLEVARQMSLRRAQQSSNPRVAQQATQKLQNNGWQVQQKQQPTFTQSIKKAPMQVANNTVDMFVKPIARSANTAGAMVTKAVTVPYAAVDLTRESITGTDQSYKNKLTAYNKFLRTGGLGKQGGLMNAGTTLQNVNELNDPKKFAGSVLETGTDLGSFVPTGKAVQAGVTGTKVLKPLLTYGGGNALMNTAGAAGMQLRETGKVDPKGLIAPAAIGFALPTAGYGLGRVAKPAIKPTTNLVSSTPKIIANTVQKADDAIVKKVNPVYGQLLDTRAKAQIAYDRATTLKEKEAIGKYLVDLNTEIRKSQSGSIGGEPMKMPNDPLEALKAEARKYKSAEEFDKFLLDRKQAGDPVIIKELDNLTKEAQKLISSGVDAKKATNQVLRNYQDRITLQPEKYKSVDEFVNAQGTPLYHGTDANFKEFSLSNFGKTDDGFSGRGVYLTARKGNAKQYGKNVVESYVKLENPLVYKDSYIFGAFSPDGLRKRLGLPTNASAEAVSTELKRRGHDGIIINENTGKGIRKNEEVVVLDPSKIKTRQQLTDLYNQATKTSPLQKLKNLDKKLGQGGFVRNPLVNPDGTPRIGKGAPIEKTAPKLAPKPIRTVFDTDKIYQSSSKAKKEVVDAAVGEEVMNRKEKYAMWKQLHNEIKSLGGINSKADELQGGYRKTSGVVFKKDGSQRLDEIAQELSSTGQYGTLTPEELLDLYENKPTIGRLADIKNKVINDLENGTHPYSDDYKAIQQDLGKRELELQDVPVTAKMVDKPDTKMTDAEWQSLQETAPMEAKSTRQAIGGELASVRKELEASKKLATQLQERQKMEVIQGKQNVASKMRDSNAKIYEDIKRLEKRERELAKQYAMESPVDNRVNMSDPKNVNLDGIEERLTSTLKDKGKKQTFKDLSREYLGSVEAAKIDADKRAMDFTKKFNLTDEEKLSVINATDNPTIKTSGKVKQAVEDLHKTYDELYAYFTKEKGVDMGYQHDYYPREYVNTKTGDQMTAAEYDLLQRASKRTKGRTSDALADWKLKYTDPAEGLKSYYQNLEKAAAGRKYMQDLEKQGLVVWGDGAPMQGYRPIIAEGLQPSKGGVYYAKKEVADKLDTMFGSKEATNIVEKALEKGEGLNSFWQSVVLSGGVPNTPINAFGFMQVMKEGMALHPIKAAKAMWGGVNKGFSQKYFEAKAPVMTLMAKEGIPIRYSISEGAKKGLGRTKAAFDESKARGINQAWNELTNDATFGRFMPLLEVQHFENIYKHGLKKGLTPEKAAKIAGDSTKNFYGITDLYSKTTRPGIVDKASGTFLFAPRFRESMLNFWGKNAKTLGVSDGKWNALKPEYRDNAKFLIAAAVTYAAYDMLNKELNGTHLWENPDGKKDKLLIPGVDPGGKTLGIPFLPSIATVPRNAGMFAFNTATGKFGEAGKNLEAFASMPFRLAGDLLTNENYFGQKIVDEKAGMPTRVGQAASYVAQSGMQPWIREGLNAAGQNLPDGVKDALGVKKKSGLETISNALESPVRFYDPKYMRGAGDNFKTPTGTVGSDKAAKNSKLTLDQVKAIQAKEYGGKYANLNQDELTELAKTNQEAANYKRSYDATVAAFGKTPNLPNGLNESAKKILERSSRLTSEGKDKWNKRETTEKAVSDNIKTWLPDTTRPPKITNEIAKQWAEYERDRLDGKINDIEANTKKRTILSSAYKSELDDVTQSFYKLGDDAMRSELEKGTISREQMNKVIEIDNILTSMGIQKYSQVGKKLRAELGYGQVSSKSSGGSSRSSKGKKQTMPNYTNISPSKGLVNTRVSSVKYAPVKKPVYKGKKVVRKIA